MADYLDVKRQYLWRLAGLLDDMEYDDETTFRDPQLKLHLARADRLPRAARMLIISLVEAVIIFFESGGTRPS